MSAQPAAVLHSVLADFPAVQHAFAYGSGVFEQPGLYERPPQGAPEGAAAAAVGGSVDRPMLDFIFAVDDPVAWHEENLKRHAHHYSFLGSLGPGVMTAVAERLGAGVYFNTLVPWRPHQLIKYGVVRLAALQQDLLHWTTLYCAGRLHKPVATLVQHPGVAAAQDANLLSALRVALLLLPERFSTMDLLHSICAISYSGDVRMGLAEDSKKVHRIVAGSEAGLRQLYAAPLAAAQQRWGLLEPAAAASGDVWVADHSPAAAERLAAALPAHLLERLAAPLGVPLPPPLPPLQLPFAAGGGWHQEASARPAAPSSQQQQQQQQQQQALPTEQLPLPPGFQSIGRALAMQTPRRRQRLLRHAIHAIVGASSKRQAVSGVLTAGLLKSARYGWAKLQKARR